MKQVYQSEDGKIFSTATECIAHENQQTITHYYMYTPKKYTTDVPVCYSVKIPKQYEELCKSLVTEFIRHNVGSDIQRESSTYVFAKVTVNQLYTIEKTNAEAYNNAVKRKELQYNPATGYLASTYYTDKSFFEHSKNASLFDNMLKPLQIWSTAPIKALTTDDLKSLKIDETLFFGINTSDPLKNFKIKDTGF